MEANGRRPDPAADDREQSAVDALQQLLTQVGEVWEYLTYFVQAKVGGITYSLRQMATLAVLGIIGLITAAGLMVTAVVLLLTGVAQGLAIAFGNRLWLGNAVTGFGLLVLLALVLGVGIRRQRRRSYAQRKQEYAERQLRQQAAFGRNVADHATDAAL